MSQISISEQLAVVRAELNQGLDKYINGLADDLMRNENVLTDKIKRKDRIIKMLQAAYKKLHAEKKLLEKKLKNVEIPTANLGMAEMKRLKEDIKILKAKNKAKQRKIRKFRLILDNISAEQYDDDPDEEDGIPSEDEGEDVEMDVADAEALLNEDDEDGDEDSDPDDSDFELNKADKDEGEKDKKDTEEFIKTKAAEKADTDEENIRDDEADKDMDKSESEASVEKAEKKEVVKSVEAEETEKKEEECEINFTQTE